ncbi:MAG: DUF6460 domain-containing protein [Devosia sp.]
MNDIGRRGTGVERVLGGSPLGVVVRLVILSFVVGVILTVLDVNAGDVIRWFEDRLRYLSNLGLGTVEEVFSILLLGAVIVVPIWLLMRVFKLIGK